ncbi:uncharacterized protein [Halyomorpha halys]|uniref:uncharacterized protein isoform X1 n=2 Tax=Halyomorpha halys TaxID=286706 RepID=UPI0006D5185F|nr:uncharacterized protein LOC106691119 isoform X1 [Halyomorpha halys]
MPVYDFIRGILGLPTREKNNENWFKKPTIIGDYEDDDEDLIIHDEYRHEGPFGFNVFSGNMHDIHKYFQQQMNEIFRNFESPWFSNPGNSNFFGAIDHGDFDGNPDMKESEKPRNKFLKPPHERNDSSPQNDGNNSQAVQVPQDRSSGFGGFFSSDPLEFHKFFEQQIDDIMKRFSSSFFRFDEGDTFGLPDENPGRVEEFIHPRNKFFKPSYEHPQGFIKPDSDIDNESYAPKVFGKLLDKEPVQPPTSPFISRSMVTTHQRKILPNGGIEEKRKSVKDGKEEVTVSRQMGDLKHVITTIKMPDGSKTKNEEFINFDEGQLGDFYRSWNKM